MGGAGAHRPGGDMTRFKPHKFGRYTLTERIARGGMAEIFVAKVHGAMGFEKNLVVKRILPEFAQDEEFLRMFVTEAKLVCNLEHPNIVQVHELGEVDGIYYITMEFVNGLDARVLWRTLAKRRQRVPMPLALYIVSEFLKGLDYAHRAVGTNGSLLGVVHRDVSLSNVMLSFLGSVKIGDFGIALVKQESKSQSGALKGKYGYMTPEHLAGHPVDHRSDVFSSGIVLAELLMGRRLFRGDSDFATMRNVINARLDVFEEHRSHFPAEVVEVVHHALQRDPVQRYQSAGEFQDDVTAILHGLETQISGKTLAGFVGGYVVPFLEPRSGVAGPVEDAGAVPPIPDRITGEARAIGGDLTPSDSSHGSTMTPQDVIDRARREIKQDAARHDSEATAPEDYGRRSVSILETYDELDEADPAPGAEAFRPGDWEAHTSQDEEPLQPALDPVEIVPAKKMRPDDLTNPDVLHEQEFELGSQSDVLPLLIEDEAAEEPQEALPSADLSHLGALPPRKRSITRPETAAILTSSTLEPASASADQESTFRGRLGTRTVAKVLFRFALAGESGLLVVTGPINRGRQAELIETVTRLQVEASGARDRGEDDQITCQIHLQEGQAQLVAADRSEEALAAYLLRIGMVSEAKLAAVIRTSPKLRPVSALLKAGQVVPLQVSRQVASFVQWLVLNVFTWTEGEFAFYRDRACAEDAFPTGKTTLQLIARGVALIQEPALDAYFDALLGYYLAVNCTPPIRIEQAEPDELLLAVYQETFTRRPVEETVAACLHLGSAVKVKQSLYFLVECELAELE
jgi:eukaryotic-like serine/threonine-protein kinase